MSGEFTPLAGDSKRRAEAHFDTNGVSFSFISYNCTSAVSRYSLTSKGPLMIQFMLRKSSGRTALFKLNENGSASIAEFKCWILVVTPEGIIEGRAWPDGCEKEGAVCCSSDKIRFLEGGDHSSLELLGPSQGIYVIMTSTFSGGNVWPPSCWLGRPREAECFTRKMFF